jgi:hypothetical protein
MIKRSLLSFIFLLQIGCSSVSKQDENISRLIDKYIPNQNINKKVRCFFTSLDNFTACGLTKDDLKVKIIPEPDSKISIASLIIAQASNDPEDQYRVTKDKMIFILKNIDDPAGWINFITGSRLEYYEALHEVAGGGNGFLDAGIGGGSLMHETIASWEDEKVNYMLSKGVDLEQRSKLMKETAILSARRSDQLSSEYVNMLTLLKHGADPRVVDFQGKGICDFLKKNKSRWDKKYPDAKENLIRELKDKHNMVC